MRAHAQRLEWIRDSFCPTRSELMRMINDAVTHMEYADAQEVRWAAAGMRYVAWGADGYAGALCPLRAAGFERERGGLGGPWKVMGGWQFELSFDSAMFRRTGLRGPGRVGICEDSSPERTDG